MVRIAIGFICGVLAALAIGAIVYHCTRSATSEGVRESLPPGARAQIAEVIPAPTLESDKSDPTGTDEPPPMSAEAAQTAIDSVEAGVLRSLFASDEMRNRIDQARVRIDAAFAEFDAANGGAEAESRLVRTLTSMNPTLFLSAVHDMMRTGDAQTRMTALTALSAVYGDAATQAATEMRGIEAVDNDTTEEPSSKAGTDEEDLDAEIRAKNRELEQGRVEDGDDSAMRVKLLVESVSAGLNGEDAEVKDAALETLMTLPDEASGILAAQILSGDDGALKQKLLAAVGDTTDSGLIRINLQAMSGEDAAARRQAADNLEKALGQRFTTAEEAAEWIEANLTNPSAEPDGGATPD